MLNDEQCSAIQIASLIEKDSVLSGSVLRCVNSAYYGLAQPISSIRQAVTLLGFWNGQKPSDGVLDEADGAPASRGI